MLEWDEFGWGDRALVDRIELELMSDYPTARWSRKWKADAAVAADYSGIESNSRGHVVGNVGAIYDRWGGKTGKDNGDDEALVGDSQSNLGKSRSVDKKL